MALSTTCTTSFAQTIMGSPGAGFQTCGRWSPISKTIAGQVVLRLTAAEKHARTMAARAIEAPP
jgi:hypothetical protein